MYFGGQSPSLAANHQPGGQPNPLREQKFLEFAANTLLQVLEISADGQTVE